MRNYIIATLDDPNGISEEAYLELRKVAEYAGDFGQNFDDIIAKVESADGRYFLPEEHGLV